MALMMPFFSSSFFDPFFSFPVMFEQQQQQPRQQFVKDVSAVANTRVDWIETPDTHVFKADLPGLSKEEMKVSLKDGHTLQISGERKREEAQPNAKYHRIERPHGCFLRCFRLPDNVNVEGVKADVSNGVLTITVPKVEVPQPKPVLIQ